MRNKSSRRKDTTKSDVAALVTVMRGAEPTPFSYEGPSVQAVRILRCLRGWPFAEADRIARETAVAALRRVGAQRPTWQEGQPVAYAEDGRACATCGGPLYGSYEIRHCSEACKRRFARVSVGLPPPARRMKHCRHCKGPLPPGRSDLRYCTDRCRAAAGSARNPVTTADLDARLGTLHRCECCGEMFRRYVRPSWPPPRFCSRRCVAIAYGKPAARPLPPGGEFRPRRLPRPAYSDSTAAPQ